MTTETGPAVGDRILWQGAEMQVTRVAQPTFPGGDVLVYARSIAGSDETFIPAGEWEHTKIAESQGAIPGEYGDSMGDLQAKTAAMWGDMKDEAESGLLRLPAAGDIAERHMLRMASARATTSPEMREVPVSEARQGDTVTIVATIAPNFEYAKGLPKQDIYVEGFGLDGHAEGCPVHCYCYDD